MIRRAPTARPYFWRTSNGAELDLLLDGTPRIGIEVKRADALIHLTMFGLLAYLLMLTANDLHRLARHSSGRGSSHSPYRRCCRSPWCRP
ncbi:MAG: hypothetical protein R2722_04800 [Tessaracoccus sp.]